MRCLKYKHLMKTFEIKEDVAKQIIIFRNIITHLNVHVVLHYKNVIIKYIIFNNYITFNDEDKYK